MELVNDIAIFEIHLTGEITKETYMGRFKVKCFLSPYEQILADKLYRDLLGDNAVYASESAKNYSFALSQLKYRVSEGPPFWTAHGAINAPGGHILDSNIIFFILDQAIEAQELFVKKKQEEYESLQNILKKSIESKQVKKKQSEETDSENIDEES